MLAPPRAGLRRLAATLLRVGLTLAALVWLSRQVDLRLAGQALAQAPLWALLVPAGLLLLNSGVHALRVGVLLRAAGAPAPLAGTWVALVQGSAMGMVLPSGGAEVAKAALVGRLCGAPAAAVAAILVARVLELVPWTLLLWWGLAWGLWAHDRLVAGAALLFSLAFSVVLLLSALLVRRADRRGPALVLAVAARLPAPLRGFAGRLRQAMSLLGHDRGALLRAGLLTLPFSLLNCLVAWTVLRGHGVSVSYLDALAVIPAVDTLISLPVTIGGLGLREGLMVGLLAPWGVDEARAVAVGLSRWAAELGRAAVGALLLLAGAGGWRGGRPVRRRAFLFALVPAVALFGGAEVVLRLWGPPPAPAGLGWAEPGWTLSDPDLGWRQAPGVPVGDRVRQDWEERWGLPSSAPPGQEERFNRLGLRDDELAFPEPPGQRRVIALGDSSVWGSGVPRALRFTERLERALDPVAGEDPHQRAVDVINAAVPAWSSLQSAAMLEQSLDLGPDVALVYSMWSDLMVGAGGVPDAWYFAGRRAARPLDPLAGLATVRWLRHGLLRLRGASSPASGRFVRVPLRDYHQSLHRIARTCRRADMGLVFIAPPAPGDRAGSALPLQITDPAEAARRRAWLEGLPPEVDQGRSASHYRQVMALVAFEVGAPLVDGPLLFARALEQAPDRFVGAEALFIDSVHPSANGHALLAQGILAPLRAALASSPDHRATRPAPGPSLAPPPREAPGGPPPGAPAGEDLSVGPRRGALPLRCEGEPTAAGEGMMAVPLVGGEEGALLLFALRPGPTGSEVVGQARCPVGARQLQVPTALGRVGLVAVEDRDGDGPCRADRVTVGVELDPSLASGLTLSLVPAGAAGPWAPPFGISPGLLPLLAAVERLDLRGELVLLVDPALPSADRLRADLPRAQQALAEGAGGGRQPALRLRPAAWTAGGVAARQGEAVVVVEPLGAGAGAALAPAAGAVVEAWTDPEGASWTLRAPRR